MSDRMANLVAETASLVSPPDVWIQLNEVVNDPSASTEDIAGVIMCDPALTAQVLKIVNSPLYPFKSPIDTVTMAISIMGTRELYSVATAVATVTVFSALDNSLLGLDTFWKHSLATASLARRLARESCVLHPERLYVAGLLHDVGFLVMLQHCPEEAGQAMQAAGGNESTLLAHERENLGFDHTELGAALMQDWRLPAPLVRTIRHCQRPEAGNDGFDAALVHLANVGATRAGFGLLGEDGSAAMDPVMPEVLNTTGLTEEALDLLCDGLEEDLSIAMSLFMPASAGAGRS